MASGILCQSCGIEAPTRMVDFHQNIGMLVMRTHRKINGMLCKKCVHKHFWKMTGTTLVLGPWGTISMILAPCYVINNVVRYLSVIGMPAVPPNAAVPALDEKAVAQLQPHAAKLIERLNKSEPLATIANDIAKQAQVTPGQVVKYVLTLSQQTRPVPPPVPMRSFPVQPIQPAALAPLESPVESPVEPPRVPEERLGL